MAVYKYKLEEDVFIETRIIDKKFRNEWISLDETGLLIVKKGYAWNGCSPKWKVLDLLFGTPEGVTIEHKERKFRPITYYASCVHDALYQFKNDVPVTRSEADELFFEMLHDAGFFWAVTYYFFVSCFGWIYGLKWGKNYQEEIH